MENIAPRYFLLEFPFADGSQFESVGRSRLKKGKCSFVAGVDVAVVVD